MISKQKNNLKMNFELLYYRYKDDISEYLNEKHNINID